MHEFVSETAIYGDLTRGPRVVDEHVRQNMERVLTEIRDGAFAREWAKENEAGQPLYRKLQDEDLGHQIEKVGASLRENMSWLQGERKQEAVA